MSQSYLLINRPAVKAGSGSVVLCLLRVLLCGIVLGINNHPGYAQLKVVSVTSSAASGAFPLISKAASATLITDTADAPVVTIAAGALSNDIFLITGKKPSVAHSWATKEVPVLIGTLGKSTYIDQLARQHRIPIEAVKGKWETFCISVIDNPLKKGEKALVVFGSDPRGTAFGVFELSGLLGVSPFVWWADVSPARRSTLYLTSGQNIVGPPSVKYRGFFINDEDWGIRPWAARNMDKNLKDIGPETYARVFELMLRLKANYLWPAMHPGTKAFWYYKENPELARKYAIIMGSSHHEPMLRDTEWEWNLNFKEEYGKEHGEWRYDTNHDEIYRFFDDRVKQSVNNDAIYTVGMRATKDGPMPGPSTTEGKVRLLEKVILDQREMLANRFGKPADQIPQVFCPYKEVLPLYEAGLKIPDDVTILWVDDNQGYIRRLSDPQEQKRSGGAGVYYHFSYWGGPQDDLWLSSTSPSLTAFEMSKAYALNARQMWVFNVGDIKPAELELQFAMDLAWDINKWTPEKACRYPEYWAKKTFGKPFARQIAAIKTLYYELAAAGKPEHMNVLDFSSSAAFNRINVYRKLADSAKELEKHIPASLKDAYFELIEYPVLGACAMNEKILLAKESLKAAAAGDQQALVYADRARHAFDTIGQLTKKYNGQIAGGKWNGMMDDHPRDREVFKMPQVATADLLKPAGAAGNPETPAPVVINASQMTGNSAPQNRNLKLISGLGVGGKGLTVWPLPYQQQLAADPVQMPYAEYNVPVKSGKNVIAVRCLPNFPLYTGMQLRYGIAVNGGEPEFISIAASAESQLWAKNVLRGYAEGQAIFESKTAGFARVRLYLPDPGLVVNELCVSQSIPSSGQENFKN